VQIRSDDLRAHPGEYSEYMRIPAGLESRPTSPPAATDSAGRPLATWQTRRPWLWAVLIGIGGTILTAFGVGFSQVRQLDPLSATYAQAAFVGLSALAGLAVMLWTRPSLAEYGFRSPVHLDRALGLLPLLAVPVVLVAVVGIRVTPVQAAAYCVLSLSVGFSEEIWFRGLLLATLRRLGTRTAIIGGSAVFGTLHLTNFFAGREPLYLVLQFAFACLVGFVLAELMAITGSLWIGIVWHFVYDLCALSTGDDLSPAALVGVACATAILAAYSVWLWRTLPRASTAVTAAG